MTEKKMVEAVKDFKEDIVCSLDETGRHVNIPQRIVRHSPTGFAWGYGGSGPADLALNILSVFIGQEAAESLYQYFKWEFIAPMPSQGGTIPREAILNWVKEKQALIDKVFMTHTLPVVQTIDPNVRWEQGIDHDPRSEEIFNWIAGYDLKFCGDYFCWKSGGDGDNGEELMYELDEYFAAKDKETNNG